MLDDDACHSGQASACERGPESSFHRRLTRPMDSRLRGNDIFWVSLGLLAAWTSACAHAQNPADAVPIHGYEIVNAWPHDPAAFTQGLVYRDGVLYESTGRVGASSLRVVELTTGRILKKVDVPPPYFAEGIALLDGKLFQLTWRHEKGFIYDPESLERLGEFRYEGEGWGLTTDGRFLIMSDGTDRLRFLDPRTFAVHKTVRVHENRRPVTNLNELQYVKGELYANIWQRDVIARIDPETGRIRGWIDLAGLLPEQTRWNPDAVLNGIAYDEKFDRLFVTGKLSPRLFEIRLKEPRRGDSRRPR